MNHWLVRDIEGQRQIVWPAMLALLAFIQVVNAAWWGAFNWMRYGNVSEHWLFPILMGIVFGLAFLRAVARNRDRPFQSRDRTFHFTLGALLGLGMSADVINATGKLSFAAVLWALFITLLGGGTMLALATLFYMLLGRNTRR
jgi:hypothetical protein